MAARDARGDDALGDAGRDGAFDDGRDRVHGPHHFGLELRGHVQLYLLEEVFGGAEAADDEDVLGRNSSVSLGSVVMVDWRNVGDVEGLLEAFDFELGWR